MWWDWTSITLLDSILFSFFSLFISYFVGFGILRLVCYLGRKDDPFSPLDFLVKTNFRIFFGFVFVFFFVLIFSAFDLPFLVSTALILIIATAGCAVSRFRFKLKLSKREFRKHASQFLVLAVLLTIVVLSSMLVAGFYGSTNDDGADHTLMVRILLDNPNSLLTRVAQPYAKFVLNYPSETHVLGAFFVTLGNVPVQKIILLLEVILPCLIALSIYSSLCCLFNNKLLSCLGLIITAFFSVGFIFSPMFWAGLPVLLSFYIVASAMGMIYLFLLRDKITWLTASLLGFIFFVSAQTYPVALLMTIFWFFIIFLLKMSYSRDRVKLLEPSSSKIFNKTHVSLALGFLVPILLCLPYLLFIVNQNLGVIQSNQLDSVGTLTSNVVKSNIGFNWLFDLPALIRFFSSGFGGIFAYASISLILIIVLSIPQIKQKLTASSPFKHLATGLFLIYIFMLVILGYLTVSLYLPINFLTTFLNPERVVQHLYIPLVLMTAIVVFSAICFSSFVFKSRFFSNRTKLTKISSSRLLTIFLFALIVLNFALMFVPIAAEQKGLFNKIELSFKTYESLNYDDIVLMNWVSSNVAPDARILVSWGDSGQYVTSVTQKPTISFHSTTLKDYSDLMAKLTANASDPDAVSLLIKNNVSYVYIGSLPTSYALSIPYYRHFNSTQFLATPYFTPIKEVGTAWLFQFNASAAKSV